jgi:hypothetical protein
VVLVLAVVVVVELAQQAVQALAHLVAPVVQVILGPTQDPRMQAAVADLHNAEQEQEAQEAQVVAALVLI